ncbi:MAG TPA: hypothetical protein PKK59_04235 [Anaerolineaceae bacterium]|nr:hypothetical protein [Anaerolineaceae bacterium]
MRRNMDLRMVKTRKSIRAAYMELRAQYPLERIRVKRLCELALINKTTFYKHYQDVYALAEEVEDETITAIMNSFESIGKLYADPERFMSGLYAAFVAHKQLIFTLFNGRMNVLLEKVQRQLVAHYPAIGLEAHKEILLSFLIKGASHVLMEAKYEEKVMLQTLTRVARQIIEFMEKPA